MNTDAVNALRDLAHDRSQELPNGQSTLGSVPAYYKGRGNLCQRLNILITIHLPRPERFPFLSAVFGRTIQSTKDLTVAEAVAFLQCDHLLPELVDDFNRNRVRW